MTREFPANIAEKSRRGRPRSARRKLVRTIYPEVKSERTVGNYAAMLRAVEQIQPVDPGLSVWLLEGRRMTVAYALAQLPPDLILDIARELRSEGITSAKEAVSLIRVVRGSVEASRAAAAAGLRK
jgi:hypothetical protein